MNNSINKTFACKSSKFWVIGLLRKIWWVKNNHVLFDKMKNMKIRADYRINDNYMFSYLLTSVMSFSVKELCLFCFVFVAYSVDLFRKAYLTIKNKVDFGFTQKCRVFEVNSSIPFFYQNAHHDWFLLCLDVTCLCNNDIGYVTNWIQELTDFCNKFSLPCSMTIRGKSELLFTSFAKIQGQLLSNDLFLMKRRQ